VERGQYKPLLVLDGFLYQHRMHRSEVRLAERVAGLLREREPLAAEGEIAGALADQLSNPVIQGGAAVVLSPEQQEAVKAVASARLTLISGGPGTGKTSIVLAMLRLLLRLGLDPEERRPRRPARRPTG
jgi:exodeoxyribonuclease V alpha subunit